jgi:hypothetical protein
VHTYSAAGGWLWKPDWRLIAEYDHIGGATKNDTVTAQVQVVF